MFKAIKENKIIAVNETGVFPCLVFDDVKEDAEHAVSDYVHVDGQFVLTTTDVANETKAAEIRAERDRRIDAMRWRIERFQTQLAADLPTTDTAEQYQALLIYVQALRDIPEQAGFPNIIEWPVIEEKTENTKDTEEPDITPESEATEETA